MECVFKTILRAWIEIAKHWHLWTRQSITILKSKARTSVNRWFFSNHPDILRIIDLIQIIQMQTIQNAYKTKVVCIFIKINCFIIKKTHWYLTELQRIRHLILQTIKLRYIMQRHLEFKAKSIFLKLILWRNWYKNNQINLSVESHRHIHHLKCHQSNIKAIDLSKLKNILKLQYLKAIQKY